MNVLLPIVMMNGLILTGAVLFGGVASAMHEDLNDPQPGHCLQRSTFLEGTIATIDGQSFTMAGLPGLTVLVNGQTRYMSTEGISMKGLRDLFANDRVRIHGYKTDTNRFVATEIQVRSADKDADGPARCSRCLTQI